MQNKGIVVLSFDDGREDLISNIVPFLEKKCIPATFNITTGYIDKTLNDNNLFCNNRPALLSDIIRLKDNDLFEIAAHGDQHLNTVEDISNSILKLKKWGLIKDDYGFASPCHGLDVFSEYELEKLRQDLGLAYLRIGTKLKKKPLAKINRRLILLSNSSSGFKKTYYSCFNSKDTHIFKCIPYNKRINIELLKMMIDEVGLNKKALVLLFHSVLKPNESLYDSMENMDYNLFKELCGYLLEKKENNIIDLCTNLEVIKTIDIKRDI